MADAHFAEQGSKSFELPVSHGFDSLNTLCYLAADTIRMKSVDLIYFTGGRVRFIAGHNAKFLPQTRSLADEGLLRKKVSPILLADLLECKSDRKLFDQLYGGEVDQLMQVLVLVGDTWGFYLLLYQTEGNAEPTEARAFRLDQIVGELARNCAMQRVDLERGYGRPAFAISLAEALSLVSKNMQATVLLDRNFNILALNHALEMLCGRPVTEVIGRKPAWMDKSAIGRSMAELGDKILRGSTTSPEAEVRGMWGKRGFQGVIGVRGSAIWVRDQAQPLLYVTIRLIDDKPKANRQIVDTAKLSDDLITTSDVVSDFLFDSLIRKRSIRSRNGVNYFTLRTWRSPIRDHQLKAFKALKNDNFDRFAFRVADEVFKDIQTTIGISAFKAVVPVPCGHSCGDRCFSVEVARQVSALGQLPLLNIFRRQFLRGTSHPKSNAKRPPLLLVEEFAGPILLIDDVATSGRHLEEAVNLLRPMCPSIMAIAWIGSDSKSDSRSVKEAGRARPTKAQDVPRPIDFVAKRR